MIGAALLRLWLLTTPALTLEADEAVTGIMAVRILDGHHRAYYAGQNYMGTLEQYLQAGVLAVLSDGDLVLRLTQVGLASVACLLVHRLAIACRLGTRRAAVAATLFAAGPYFLVYWSVKSRGGYAAATVLSLLGLLVAVLPEQDEARRGARAVAFGLVAGLAFWTNQQSAIVLAPAAWWLWAALRERPARHAALACGGFVAGALPALWHTAATGRTPFAAGGGSSTVLDRLQHLVTATVPDVLGLRDDGQALLPFLPPTLVGLLGIVALAVVAVRRRHGLVRFLRLEVDDRDPADLLLAVVCVAPVTLLASGTSTEATARFLFVVYPVLAVLAVTAPVPATARQQPLLALAPALLLLGHTVLGARWLIADDDGGHVTWTGAVVRSADVEGVLATLRAEGARTAYADYWLAQPLTWSSGGDVLVEPIYQRRFEHVTRAIGRDPEPALIVSDEEVDSLRRVLAGAGLDGRFVPTGQWWVVTGVPVEGPLPEAPTVADAVAARHREVG